MLLRSRELAFSFIIYTPLALERGPEVSTAGPHYSTERNGTELVVALLYGTERNGSLRIIGGKLREILEMGSRIMDNKDCLKHALLCLVVMT